MVQEDIEVCHSIRDYTLAHGGAQQSFGAFPPGRPPHKVIEYTIGLRLPRIGEWMGEPQRAVYPLMIDFHLGYHQAWAREQGTHRVVLGYHHEFLVMPLGLTKALVTFQSFMQWQRHLLLLFDALILYNRTGEDYWSEWDETGGSVVVTEFTHLDFMISSLSAQYEIQTYLDRFTEIAVGGVVDGII
jgi:hypothetical protein